MRIAMVTAGAAGMYCGSCLRDNALVKALRDEGHDAVLVATYTPITTDEVDMSTGRVFYGGINVYLQEKSSLFRHTPRFVDSLLDRPRLLKWVSRYAHRAQYDQLGGLTISMLQGEHGHQRKELDRLVAWFRDDLKPEVVLVTNVLLSGMVPELKERLKVPVFAYLQGDDIFLDALLAEDKAACLDLIRTNCESLNGLIATSHYYADHMSGYLGINRSRIEVIPPGINLQGHGGPKLPRSDGRPVIGFFARIAPEKGLHNLVGAFIELRRSDNSPRLRVSGWLGEQNKPYLDEQRRKLAAAGLADEFEYVDSPSHDEKSKFLRSLDVLCVPTEYREPKGLYVLEAWANRIPVVLPSHGCFPELVESTGGGVLTSSGDNAALAKELHAMVNDRPRAEHLGALGRAAVESRYSAAHMARATLAYLQSHVGAA